MGGELFLMRVNGAFWFLFCVVWLTSALFAGKIIRGQTSWARLQHFAEITIGFLFCYLNRYLPPIFHFDFYPGILSIRIAGIGMTALGVGFMFWARYHLGKLWSAQVSIKESHHIVKTGPYGIARHPIYTGFLVAFLGTVITSGTTGALVGFCFLLHTGYQKIKIEEAVLLSHFGDAYRAYMHDIGALFPHLSRPHLSKSK